MTTAKGKPYNCEINSARVIILKSTHQVSGIGSCLIRFQADYECSMENNCSHSAQPTCPIHRLNMMVGVLNEATP